MLFTITNITNYIFFSYLLKSGYKKWNNWCFEGWKTGIIEYYTEFSNGEYIRGEELNIGFGGPSGGNVSGGVSNTWFYRTFINNLKKGKYIILVLIITVIYIRFFDERDNRRALQFYNYFYEKNIKGVLESVRGGRHGSIFKVKGFDEFTFHPCSGKLNNNKIFDYFAAKGDSIYKQAYSDTLKLIKNEKTYLYTFQKFDWMFF